MRLPLTKGWKGKPEMHSRWGSEENISLAHVHFTTDPINYSLKRSPVCTLKTHVHLHLLTFLEVTTPNEYKVHTHIDYHIWKQWCVYNRKINFCKQMAFCINSFFTFTWLYNANINSLTFFVHMLAWFCFQNYNSLTRNSS